MYSIMHSIKISALESQSWSKSQRLSSLFNIWCLADPVPALPWYLALGRPMSCGCKETIASSKDHSGSTLTPEASISVLLAFSAQSLTF